jgi:hypothetical protein
MVGKPQSGQGKTSVRVEKNLGQGRKISVRVGKH